MASKVEMDQRLLFDSSRAPKTGGNRRQTDRVRYLTRCWTDVELRQDDKGRGV